MVTIDPRLLDLIETLRRTRLDWLALEVLDGIREGRRPIEAREALEGARQEARSSAKPKPRRETKQSASEQRPIMGDEQIDWASAYVAQRLEDAVSMLDAAAANLDAILGSPDPEQLALDPIGSIEYVFLEGDATSERLFGHAELEVALASIPKLRVSLDDWALSSRQSSSS